VLLAWLVLALSVAPTVEASPSRAQAVLVGAAAASLPSLKAPPLPATSTALDVEHVAPPVLRVAALVLPSAPQTRPWPPAWIVRDGRSLYLSNCRVLC
jgi:hypothetical protein